MDSYKSGDIDEKEFGWYMADCAGLADYGDGSLDGYDEDAMAHAMKKELSSFEEAVDNVLERRKARGDTLNLASHQRKEYQDTVHGHRFSINKLFIPGLVCVFASVYAIFEVLGLCCAGKCCCTPKRNTASSKSVEMSKPAPTTPTQEV